jgi:sugar phosphate isomerase/epimerase
MRPFKVALQLYTLRDFCGSAKDLATTLKKVKAIGYDAVEFVHLDFASNRDLRKLADDHGLAISSIHEAGDRLLNQPQKVAEDLTELGTDLAVYPYPAGIDFQKGAEVDRLARQLEHSAEVFAATGQRLVYHNHALEFAKHDEKVILEYIFANAPKLFAELDTYWIQFGGGDPARWIANLQGRVPLIHLKDYKFNPRKNIPEMAEVGRGNLDFATIIEQGKASGCEWFVVEQDFCEGDPFIAIQVSLEYLKENGGIELPLLSA